VSCVIFVRNGSRRSSLLREIVCYYASISLDNIIIVYGYCGRVAKYG